MLLVLENVTEGFGGLFSPAEKKVYTDYKALSNESQTLFARLLTRKRVWYSVNDHLSKYGDFESLQESLSELIDSGFLSTHTTIQEELLHRVQQLTDGGIVEEDSGSLALESLSQLLESLTVGQLKEVGKVATKAIRKVPLENILEVHEVATYNPLFKYLEHLKAIDGQDDERSEDEGLISQLTKKCEQASMRFSGLFVEYMNDNERKYKSHLSKRKLVHKILQRVDGLMNVTEAHFAEKSGDAVNTSVASNESAATQQNLLQFFRFKQTQTQVRNQQFRDHQQARLTQLAQQT